MHGRRSNSLLLLLSAPRIHSAAAALCTSPVGDASRLKAIQRAARDGATTTASEEAMIERVGGEHAATYGEITPLGMTTLGKRMGLGADDVFADLGSGLGRAVVQAVAEFNVKRSVGVELAGSRHRRAMMQLYDLDDGIASRVRFVLGDCADSELWGRGGCLEDVTALYISSLLFAPPLMQRLADRLATAPACLRMVASLKPFPDAALLGGGGDDGAAIRWVKQPPEDCETSWTAGMLVADAQGGMSPHPGSAIHVYVRAE